MASAVVVRRRELGNTRENLTLPVEIQGLRCRIAGAARRVDFPAWTNLALMVLAVLVPLIALAFAFISELETAQRDLQRKQMLSTLHALSASVDERVMLARSALDMLMVAPAIDEGNFARLYG
ncbi:MAG: hypothetical protein ACRD3W_21040, partial [Terriglobales bacterium]